ncbi:hypothetical protein M409DRAFT_54907 [Zasmidium cellare ATCC 36951]|uniref:non-specific serine/threonine protein kinase n=1 Tax=Zasmidium cellare ATCC 36951 TaxID=1080233 RepID=A0A6A6CHA7_ZASCE|nr:uncharacterized protein M409DRAFT_54907 [Zasmidium cellare ATCC 36951]KAF2166574.1 hypothetical protein M409DRAFT_54907 [Zasmidium cellare ATCC 36951]
MPPGRPPGAHGSLRVRDVALLFTLGFAPLAAAALQQQPYISPEQHSTDGLANAASSVEQRWHASVADSLHTPLSGQRGFRDTDANVNNKDNSARTPINQRALATVSSPSESHSASGQPPAQWSATTSAGLTRRTARSLQDWQVEDIMLLATVDGKLHALERATGHPRWVLETDREMVETTRHRRQNKTVDEQGVEQEDPLFIVEPSQDGSIYLLAPGFGLRKLDYTVRQLAELSPYAGDGFPAVAYTAEKKNTLYTVDAATGNILKSFSSAGSIVNDDRSCRRASPLDVEANECEPIGTLTVGRTEYTIGVQDRNTGEPISTIRYFEWGPNNRDQDLRNKYKETMDHKYVYSKYDGEIQCMDYSRSKYHTALKPKYRQKLSSPVARVFDVVRPTDDLSSDASLVILPQPVGPSGAELDDEVESVWVDCTKAGNWYALSEKKYPTVTEKAPAARYLEAGDSRHLRLERKHFAGVHYLSLSEQYTGSNQVDGGGMMTIDGPPVDTDIEKATPRREKTDHFSILQTLVVLAIMGLCGAGFMYQQQLGLSPLNMKQMFKAPEVAVPVGEDVPEIQVEDVKIREAEPAKETIFPQDTKPSPQVRFAESVKVDEKLDEAVAEGEDKVEDGGEPKKRKATRGKRAGRKQKEKEAAQAEARAKKTGTITQAAEVITVADSESPQVTGPLQINSLIINTDSVIGQGSCGTIVFTGSFEGREVAVKRMLAQYYELASQEVSFLQQSDDHPNVVRYFCQQKDNHFLYIAVELCQASLFEVWEAENAKTEERRQRLRALKITMQQNMTKTLHQLAAGLCHLHNLRIIHRDIKPQNILVAYPKKTQQPNDTRLVISDFGLGKNLPENVSTLVDPTGNAGTSGWKAPELISQPKETTSNNTHSTSNGSESGTLGFSGVKRAADIFSLGCLFFWALTDGVHPYEDAQGWPQLREYNIKQGKKNMEALQQWYDAYEPMQLISSMLAHQPENRPTAQAVLNHPYFWTPEKRLAFLCDVSDHFEREPRGTYDDGYAGDSLHLHMLEQRAVEVIGEPCDFLGKLDRSFVDTLGRQRKYSGNRLLDLLRALRNKKNHYEDMPEDVKKRVGPLPGGYLNYWSHRFPKLLMTCYQVVHDLNVQGNDRFKGYSELGSS